MEHHPIADLFPMLPEDELKDLAHDIAGRGLLQPIVLDGEGRILDGRNRYAACELADVEPEFETYDGDDPDGFALAVNIARRHLTKGQIAMLVVHADGVLKKSTQRQSAATLRINHSYLSRAQTVSDHATDLVDKVIAGHPDWPLHKAYEEARQRKQVQEEGSAELAELRGLAPDLIVFVENGMRELDDALQEGRYRKIVHDIDQVRTVDGAPSPSFTERVEDESLSWKEAAELAQTWQEERTESILRHQKSIRDVTSGWGAVRTIRSKESPFIREILDGLGQADRTELDNILSELKKR